VLFVNGIPFGVMECKRSGQPTAEDPLEQAISQQLRESEIPQLFHYTQVLFTLAVNQAKYGATGTPLAFWQGWREQKLPDHAVVELRYEGRAVQQHVDQVPIDQWLERYTQGLTTEQRADLKRKYSSADQLNRTEQKVRAIAWDLSAHFQTNFKGTGFKGQLVTPSKSAALLYKRFLDEFGIVSSEVLISPPDTFCCSCRSRNCGVPPDSRVPSADKCAGEVIGAGDALVTFV
jgi:type I site-specific restriction-modification system R (restriction) subunit